LIWIEPSEKQIEPSDLQLLASLKILLTNAAAFWMGVSGTTCTEDGV
jgi:hypothetical protein